MLTLAFLLPTVLATPTLKLNDYRASYTETWQIPRLDVHFLSKTTGLPGNPPWPYPPPFNSSISFDIRMPATHIPSSPATNRTTLTTCHVEFPDGILPLSRPNPCVSPSDRETTTFALSMLNTTRRAEMSFSIDVQSLIDAVEGEDEGGVRFSRVYWAHVDVEGNAWGEENMRMMCALGPPMDGMRCRVYPGVFGVGVTGWGEGLEGKED